jgi:hypothetical protein
MLGKFDRTRPCRCGSGMAALFTVRGLPACPRCVEWTLLHSNPRTWAELSRRPEPTPAAKRPRPRQLVTS